MPLIFRLDRQADEPGPLSNTSGQQAVASNGAATLIASVSVVGVGRMGINWYLDSGALTDIIIALASSIPQVWTLANLPVAPGQGDSRVRLTASAGDFALVSNFLTGATAQPHQMAAGGGAFADFDLQGRYTRMDVWAKSTTPGTVITTDANGMSVNVG